MPAQATHSAPPTLPPLFLPLSTHCNYGERSPTNRRVQATEKLAQKSCSQNAFYLDDQMSGWEFYGNTIVNSTTGVLLGGGRRNVIRGNVFRGNQLDIAFDNRGMSWQTSYCEENCTAPCFHVRPWAMHACGRVSVHVCTCARACA